jgi:alkylation response protein AidB-like acyl-CoA dehydrogenase
LNFNDTEQEAAYRQKAIDFLEQHAEKKVMGQVGVSARLSPQALLQAAKKWQALKADHDFACISWPKEWGGPGGSAIESVIFAQEEQRFDIPEGIFQVSLGVCMPSVIKLGSEELKNRFVKPALRGEEIWCQLFSEPAAGSDLAGIRTKGVDQQRAPFGFWPTPDSHRSVRGKTFGADHVLGRYAHTRYRGAAHQSNFRSKWIQRGLLHGCVDSRLSAYF